MSARAAEARELSSAMRDELMDPAGWRDALSAYARTVGMAVALTDCDGCLLGECQNAQPVWKVAKAAGGRRTGSCPFCVHPPTPCQAVRTALSGDQVELTTDGTGMVHLAVPLILGERAMGAIIAGQVFNQYPDALRMQRLAVNLGISPQGLWRQAREQAPVRTGTLKVYGELLQSLGNAFLRQRYAAILDWKLEQANRRLRLLLEGVKGHALFTLDGDGRVTSWNGGAERMYGYSERDAVALKFETFFSGEDNDAGVPARTLQKATESGMAECSGWQVRADGTKFFGEGSVCALGCGASREFGRLILDTTEKRNAEEAVRHTQRLESIGVLASGIAHDFNNLLTTILGGMELAEGTLTPDHPAIPSLKMAEQAGEKAAGLTQQLLAYAGHGKFAVTRFDLSELIRETLDLLRTSIGKSAVLEIELEQGLPWIEADASQIQQIVMNLAINASEAMCAPGGVVSVTTGSSSAPPSGSAESVAEVWMEVRDDGCGMTEETKAKIFDPFFTTKFTGRGLGLAAVSGIVRGHGGRMSIESELGRGSTFRVCFPAVPAGALEPEKPRKLASEPMVGTVLVAEDEPALRAVARMMLERFGYKTIAAANGREAVEAFRKNSGTISAVLMDLTMPVMGGQEAIWLIREIRGDVPIVVTTGYSQDSMLGLFDEGETAVFLQKPYTADHLREKMEAACRTGD